LCEPPLLPRRRHMYTASVGDNSGNSRPQQQGRSRRDSSVRGWSCDVTAERPAQYSFCYFDSATYGERSIIYIVIQKPSAGGVNYGGGRRCMYGAERAISYTCRWRVRGHPGTRTPPTKCPTLPDSSSYTWSDEVGVSLDGSAGRRHSPVFGWRL